LCGIFKNKGKIEEEKINLDEFGVNSLQPSLADIDVLNSAWSRNPNGLRPVSQILTGQDEPIRFWTTGLEPTPKKNPNKR